MEEDDSDGEFERFLQEDEDSTSPIETTRKPPRASAYSSSSVSAVTSAAAALLASTKLKSHKSKSKSKSKSSEKKGKSKKKKAEKQESFSDSEDPPPSYYAASSTRADALFDSDADPYAFDMGTSFHPVSQEEDEEAVRRKGRKEREQQREEKQLKEKEKKAATKSAPISLDERMAEILKRTGSTQFQGSLDEAASDDGSQAYGDKPHYQETNERLGPSTASKARDEGSSESGQDKRDAGSEDESNLLDSLGIDSADFEVRLPVKAALERPRTSITKPRFSEDRGKEDNSSKSDDRSSQSDSLGVNSADFEVRLPVKANLKGSQTPATRDRVSEDSRESRNDSGSEKQSRLSDSLGINSADFEVRVATKATPEPSRLSLSSLKSEKFSVNVDALGDIELATPSRYEQQQATFLQSEKGDDSASDGDYEDEEFELDQTTTGVVGPSLEAPLPAPSKSAEDRAGVTLASPTLEQQDSSFVSEFEKMKELLMADPVLATDANADAGPDDKQRVGSQGKPALGVGGGSDIGEISSVLDASGNFGYDDEDFEDDEASRQNNTSQEAQHVQVTATNDDMPSQPFERGIVQDSAAYDYDDFEADQSFKEEEKGNSVQASVEPSQAFDRNNEQESSAYDQDDFEMDQSHRSEEQSASIQTAAQPMVDAEWKGAEALRDDSSARDARLAALLAEKYGDFYADDEDDGETEEKVSAVTKPDEIPVEHTPVKTETQHSMLTNERELTVAAPAISLTPISAKAAESPPSSPPPPPPPEDEDDIDGKMDAFVLEPTRTQDAVRATIVPSTAAPRPQVPPQSAADRFQQIESQVASLRFLQPVTPTIFSSPVSKTSTAPKLQAVELSEVVHPIFTSTMTDRDETVVPPVEPPAMAPLAISFDLDLLAREEEENQRGIDEFLQRSQVLRQSQRGIAVRASTARENELVLRLQQAQRQILQLKTFIQEMEGDVQPVNGAISSTNPAQPIVPAVEAEGDGHDVDSEPVKAPTTKRGRATVTRLQKEIKTQDTLIAAFQKENERLMRQLKQVQQDVQYDVHQANEELRRQVKQLQEQLGNASPPAAPGAGGGDGGFQSNASKAQHRAAVEARLDAEAKALALQEELATVRLMHQQKVNELNLELDRVKKAKTDLECRYEGIDLKQVAHEAQQTRELQNELSLCKKEHAHALATLQKKLDWYVENQRLLDDQDDELRRLRKALAEKESTESTSAAKASPPKPSPARSHRRSPADIRRIQELESRLTELEEAMRRRHPDSLANLILASRRADEEDKSRAMEQEYEDKLAAMAQELEQAHERSETRLASFRQQQEKLLLQFRRKIKEQEKQLKQSNKPSHPATRAPLKKDPVDVSDDELQRVRKFYASKIKELERKWEAKYRAQRKQQFAGLGRTDATHPPQGQQQNLTYADSAVVIANLQKKLREQELKLKTVRVEQQPLAPDQEERSAAGSDVDNDEVTLRQEQQRSQSQKDTGRHEMEERVRELEAQLHDSEDARARLVQTLSTVQSLGQRGQSKASSNTSVAQESSGAQAVAASDSKSSPMTVEMQAELVQLHQELAATREALSQERSSTLEKTTVLEAQTREHSEKSARLQTQLAANLGEVHRLQTLVLEGERHNRALESQAQRVPELEQEVLALRRELELPRTPSMVQYRTLALQVATLEQKHQLREAELKVVLDRALASSRLEKLSAERAHRAALAAKNVEIAAFKRQLEDILAELALLQLPPSARPKSLQTAPSEDQADT